MQDLGDHKKHPLDLRLKNTLSFPQASRLNKATLPSLAGLPSLPPPLSAPSSCGVTLVLEAPDSVNSLAQAGQPQALGSQAKATAEPSILPIALGT